MQLPRLQSNQAIVDRSDQGTKLNNKPNSPAGVINGERYFSNEVLVTNDHFAPTITCGCFRFWDFFATENEQEDTFTTIALKDIKPVSAEEEYSDQKRTRDSTHSTTQHENCVNDIVDDEIVSMQGSENYQERINHEASVGTANDDTDPTKPSSEGFKKSHQEEKEDPLIKLSFSLSSFSDGDSSYLANDRDNIPQVINRDEEQKTTFSEDNSTDGSSSLSFDANDFDEQDFEADYGLVESKPINFNGDSMRDSLRDNAIKNFLPTIVENSENSFCDVGSNFNPIFICNR